MKRCIMILADGARADVMRDLAERGQLPAISEHMIEPGSLRAAVTAFPSTTGPAYLPYLTGCYPGTCNLPGIRWFDKDCYADRRFSKNRFRSYVGAESFYMNGDLAADKKTLFEIIPRSVNVFSSINRGAGLAGDRTKFSRIWYWYYAHLTDRWGMVDDAAGRKVVAALERDPEFVFAVFPAIDEYSHLSSPFHPRTIEAYEGLDRAVGKIADALKARGWAGETAIFIVSDHGLSETSRHFPLNQFLEKSGIETLYYPKILFKRRFEAASMVSGNGMANVYLKNGEGWKGRAPWEHLSSRSDRLVERLLEQPEVDLLAAQREDGAVVVKSKKGEAVLSENGSIRYEVKGGSDPFGYPQLPKTMSDRESLQLTEKTDYPDAPAQLLQIFRSRRAGDLILSAAKGSDLRLRYEIHEHKSSHGSLHWEHMQVPLVSNVRLSEGPVRSVDVFPTVLSLLGRPIPAEIDGKSLLGR
jgi:hypothetical protein